MKPSDVKRPHVLIRNPDTGEPWLYCGPIPAADAPGGEWAALATVLGEFVAAELGNADGDSQIRGDNLLTIELKHEMLTDAEAEALPEM